MRKRTSVLVAGIMVTGALAGAPSATAAIEVGSHCGAVTGVPSYTLVPLVHQPGSSLPIAAPSSGVVTKWRVSLVPVAAVPQQLKVVRPTGAPNSFQTIAESTVQTVISGVNTFEARIPVQAGDRFGLYSDLATLYCAPIPGSTMGVSEGNLVVGASATFGPAATTQVAVSATIEPDADGDGFGDETQDRCPQSAASQAECPTISLASYGLVRKGSALVLVAVSQPAAVTLTGAVRTTGKKGPRRRARASAQVRLRGGTKPVAPGRIISYTLRFPARLKSELAALPRSRSLTLQVTASTTDVAGRPSSSKLKLKLKGQKPKGKVK